MAHALADITNIAQAQGNIRIGHLAIKPTTTAFSPSCFTRSSTLFTNEPSSPDATSPLSHYGLTPTVSVASSVATTVASPHAPTNAGRSYSHDPYNWRCIPETDAQAAMLLAQRNHLAAQRASLRCLARMQSLMSEQFAAVTAAAAGAMLGSVATAPEVGPALHHQPTIHLPFLNPLHNVSAAATATIAAAHVPPPAPVSTTHESIAADLEREYSNQPPLLPANQVCRALVQFKCHQGEFASGIMLDKGQYVVVQGDRGIDIGVVIRINSENEKSYIERTGPSGSVMRHATQREVDYWASELKQDEATALDFCRQRVIRSALPMEVRHAEYQFDKKKLTFYYDAKTRVDFVSLLKELYREFGCRIWMEKVRQHE